MQPIYLIIAKTEAARSLLNEEGAIRFSSDTFLWDEDPLDIQRVLRGKSVLHNELTVLDLFVPNKPNDIRPSHPHSLAIKTLMEELHREAFNWKKDTEFDAEKEGMSGYCFIVAEILHDQHPTATVYRLTQNGSDFAHVYLLCGNERLDIKGFRGLDQMVADLGGGVFNETKTDFDSVRNYFHKFTELNERQRAKREFIKFIQENKCKFRVA